MVRPGGIFRNFDLPLKKTNVGGGGLLPKAKITDKCPVSRRVSLSKPFLVLLLLVFYLQMT